MIKEMSRGVLTNPDGVHINVAYRTAPGTSLSNWALPLRAQIERSSGLSSKAVGALGDIPCLERSSSLGSHFQRTSTTDRLSRDAAETV